MSRLFDCPFLATQVELTDERLLHIKSERTEFGPYIDRLASVLGDPDVIRKSNRDPATRLFARWYDDVRLGKYVIVVVVSHEDPDRHWVVTAYLANRPTGGTTEWAKS